MDRRLWSGARFLFAATWLSLSWGANFGFAQSTAENFSASNDVLTDDVLRMLGVERGWVASNEKLRSSLVEAIARFRKGDGEGTLDKLEDARAGESRPLPPAKLILARMLLAVNNIAQARQQLDQVFKENRRDCPEVFLLFGNLGLAEGRMTDAYLSLTQAGILVGAQGDGRSTVSGRWSDDRRNDFLREVYAGKVSVFEQLQDWQQAQDELIPWLAMNPDDPIAHLRGGRIIYLKGVASGVDDAGFERYYAEAKRELVTAYKYQKSKGVYKTDPVIERPEVVLLNLHTAAGKLELAEGEIKQIDANKPLVAADAKEGGRIYTQISMWYLRQGRFVEARKYAEEATAMDKDAPALKALSAMLAFYDNDPAAEVDFEKLYQANPGDFFASNYLALVLSESPEAAKRSKAIQIAETNARLNQQSAEAISTLGWCYYNDGRFAEAAKVMNVIGQGAKISPDTAYYFARVLFKNNGLVGGNVVNLLKSAVESKGPFKHRKEATDWLNALEGK